MNCYGTVKIYEVKKSYKVEKEGKFEWKPCKNESEWQYELVGEDKHVSYLEDLILMQREWLRRFIHSDGLKFEYIIEEIF